MPISLRLLAILGIMALVVQAVLFIVRTARQKGSTWAVVYMVCLVPVMTVVVALGVAFLAWTASHTPPVHLPQVTVAATPQNNSGIPTKSKKPSTRSKKKPSKNSPAAKPEADEPLELPPRAGTIPVDQELAAGEALVETAVQDDAPEAESEAPPFWSVPIHESPETAVAPTQAPPVNEVLVAEAAAPQTPEPAPIVELGVPELQPNVVQVAANRPTVEVLLPADAEQTARPAWVDSTPHLEGSVYRVAVCSGLYVDAPECQRALDKATKKAASAYIEEYLGPGTAWTVAIEPEYLRQHVVKAKYSEELLVSVGPMKQIHALLEFNDDVRDELHRRWHAAVVSDRLLGTGVGAAGILGAIGVVYGFLRLHLATKSAPKAMFGVAAVMASTVCFFTLVTYIFTH